MRHTRSTSAFVRLKRFGVGETGQDLMEYGLLVSLIATFLIGTLNIVGDRLDVVWQVIADGIRY